MNDTVTVKQGDEEMKVNLADIAGIDMNAVEAFEGGFEATPKGVYLWDCKDAKIDTINEKAVIQFELECQECYAILDDDKTPESMVGWKHYETIFISDLAKSVGQAKAIMQNAGFQGSGTLEQMLDAFCGTQFISPIKNRKDKNDTDRVYANLVVGKITPPKTAAAEPSLVGGAATPAA